MDSKLKWMKEDLREKKKEFSELCKANGLDSEGNPPCDENGEWIDEDFERPDDVICLESDIERLEDDIHEYIEMKKEEKKERRKAKEPDLYVLGFPDGSKHLKVK